MASPLRKEKLTKHTWIVERLWSEHKESRKINRKKLAITKATEISKKYINTEMKLQFNSLTEKYAEVR